MLFLYSFLNITIMKALKNILVIDNASLNMVDVDLQGSMTFKKSNNSIMKSETCSRNTCIRPKSYTSSRAFLNKGIAFSIVSV